MDWGKLRQLIEAHFDLEELRTLCFDLHVDYDSLRREGKSGKVQDVVDLFRRTRRMPELIAYLAAARPSVSWGELRFDDASAQPPPQPRTPASAQQAGPPTQPPAQRSSDTPQEKSNPTTSWKNWGDHPLVVTLGVIAALVSIVVGIQAIAGMIGSASPPTTGTAAAPLGPSLTIAPAASESAAVTTPQPETTASTATAAAASPFVEETRATATPTAIGGGTGRIAFASDRSGVSTIYVVDADDGQVQQLVRDSNMEARRPVWSSDGSQIAFNVTSAGTVDIYVSSVDGSSVSNLTNNPQRDYSRATWSPDATRIAFGALCGADNLDICVLRIGDTQPTRITKNEAPEYDPAWSPTGDQIAFVSSNGDGTTTIYLMNVDGSGQVPIASGSGPVWSPDGTRIAFTALRDGNYDIYVVNADGSNEVRSTTNPAREASPTWSPDGTKIAFISTRDEPNGGTVCNDDTNTSCKYTIYYMNADGSNTTRVTNSNENSRAPMWQPIPKNP